MLNIQSQTWANTRAEFGGRFLPAGGHKCVIKNVEQKMSKSGKPMIAIAFDISGGEYDGYYMDLFGKNVEKAQKDGTQAKWPNGGVIYQLIDDEHLGRFKGVIENIEKSNVGFTFNMDEKSLIGKFFGGVFREEEYEAQDGSIKTAVRCNAIREVEGIEDIPVPKKKCLVNKPQDNSPMGNVEIPF